MPEPHTITLAGRRLPCLRESEPDECRERYETAAANGVRYCCAGERAVVLPAGESARAIGVGWHSADCRAGRIIAVWLRVDATAYPPTLAGVTAAEAANRRVAHVATEPEALVLIDEWMTSAGALA